METGEISAPRPPLRIWERTVAVAHLVRFRTGLAGATLSVAGARLAAEEGPTAEVALAAISIAFLIAFAQAFNDIVDRDLDARIKPFRPLPAGTLSLPAARVTAAACAAVGFLSGAVADPRLAPFALVLLALSWLYSRHLKSTVLLGNLVVAALASSCVPYGAVIGGVEGKVFAAQSLVLSFSFAVELLKTTMDAQGDAAAGITTVATRYGRRTGALCSAAICAVATAVALALIPLAAHPQLYAPTVVLTAVLPTLVAARFMWTWSPADGGLESALSLLRIAWLGGIVSLLLL
jgi:geranylgeranylglycerol-phosphate geranylgeranyltransferase